MIPIADEITQILGRENEICEDAEECKKYADALELYKSMLKEGIIKPRGNRLADIEDRVKTKIKYNIPTSQK